MKQWIFLIMCMISIGIASATSFNLTPNQCILDQYSNNTYCGVWPNVNVQKTLNWGESWSDTNINVNITSKPFPFINEVFELGYTEQKSWNDYNLTVKCANVSYETFNMGVNSSYTDDKHRVTINCAKDVVAVQNATHEMFPGDKWYNIECKKIPTPITGTIILSDNTTWNETYAFDSNFGSCLIDVEPSNMLINRLGFAEKYSACEIAKSNIQNTAADEEKAKERYMIILSIVTLCGGFFAFLWMRDLKTGQIFQKFTGLQKKSEEKEKPVQPEKIDLNDKYKHLLKRH